MDQQWQQQTTWSQDRQQDYRSPTRKRLCEWLCSRCSRGNFAEGPRAHWVCRGSKCMKPACQWSDTFTDGWGQKPKTWPNWAVEQMKGSDTGAAAWWQQTTRPHREPTPLEKAKQQLEQAKQNSMPDAVIQILQEQLEEEEAKQPLNKTIDQRLGQARTALSVTTYEYDMAVANRDKLEDQLWQAGETVQQKEQEMADNYQKVQTLLDQVAREAFAHPDNIAGKVVMALDFLTEAIEKSWPPASGPPQEGLVAAMQNAQTIVHEFRKQVGQPSQPDLAITAGPSTPIGPMPMQDVKVEQSDAEETQPPASQASQEQPKPGEPQAKAAPRPMRTGKEPKSRSPRGRQPGSSSIATTNGEQAEKDKSYAQAAASTKPSQIHLEDAMTQARQRLPQLRPSPYSK